MPPAPLIELDDIDLTRVLMTREQIYQELPHRHEFMQLDGLVYMNDDVTAAVAFRDVRPDEFWVRGHLPGRPIFPGVLMIETAAQIASLVASRYGQLGDRFIGLSGVDKAKFRGVVEPNQRLYILAKLLRSRERRFECMAQGVVDGKIVFEAQIIGMTI